MRFYDTVHSTTIPSTQLEVHSSCTNNVTYSFVYMQQQHKNTFGGSVCRGDVTNEVSRNVSGLCWKEAFLYPPAQKLSCYRDDGTTGEISMRHIFTLTTSTGTHTATGSLSNPSHTTISRLSVTQCKYWLFKSMSACSTPSNSQPEGWRHVAMVTNQNTLQQGNTSRITFELISTSIRSRGHLLHILMRVWRSNLGQSDLSCMVLIFCHACLSKGKNLVQVPILEFTATLNVFLMFCFDFLRVYRKSLAVASIKSCYT